MALLKLAPVFLTSALLGGFVYAAPPFAPAPNQTPDTNANHCVIKEFRARIDNGTILGKFTNSIYEFDFEGEELKKTIQTCEAKTGQSSSYKNEDVLYMARTMLFFKPGSVELK